VRNFYKKYELALWFTAIPILILIFRFEDVRGSYFITTIDFSTVNGKIVESKITHGHRPNYRFNISYNYEVNGIKYTNSRVGFGFKGSNDKSSVTEILSRYPVGKKVQVYFDSQQPNFSVLEPERNSRNDFYIVLFLSLAGILFSIIVVRRGITSH
jgi:hypothetical protein